MYEPIWNMPEVPGANNALPQPRCPGPTGRGMFEGRPDPFAPSPARVPNAMARRTLPLSLVAPVLALAFTTSCTSVAVPPGGATPGAWPAAETRLAPVDAAWVESTLGTLSLEAQVGQLVFPWISGAYWADDDPEMAEALRWVENDEIGGVVISIGTPLAYAAKLNALQARARVPLLVTSDFENGGPGMRIAHLYALPTLLSAGGGTSFPPTMAFGAVGDEGLVERFARATAREARAVGVHVIFAPVLDVNSNPENPII
ncbi:MAG: hypothetical protein EA350_15345, partial [Gemmatimonadales bacterium]